jgi:hypothetical protein
VVRGTAGARFDDRLESDITAGKPDWLVEEALAEHQTGQSRKLP